MRKLKLREVKDLPKLTQPERARARTGFQVPGFWNQSFLTLPFLFPLLGSKRCQCRRNEVHPLTVAFQTLAQSGGSIFERPGVSCFDLLDRYAPWDLMLVL